MMGKIKDLTILKRDPLKRRKQSKTDKERKGRRKIVRLLSSGKSSQW